MPFIVGRFTSFYPGIVFDKTFFVLFEDVLRLYFRKTITEVLNTEYSINTDSKWSFVCFLLLLRIKSIN